MIQQPASLIPRIQKLLYRYFGPLNWWPADNPFEVTVGAILTQNTAWTNVEYALKNLKKNDCLSPEQINSLAILQLEELIKPSGFFRQKAARLKAFCTFLVENWQADIGLLCSGPLVEARNRLLDLHGIGPETADSILLYAASRKSFVVDAYTRRVFQRIGLLQGDESYDEIRALFMQHLPEDVELYNEYHAGIVNLAKRFCRKTPLCEECPVNEYCNHALKTTSI